MTTQRRPAIRTLRELRLAAGLTLPELADDAGINRGDLSRIERGRVVALASELERLSVALDVRLENRMQVVAGEDLAR